MSEIHDSTWQRLDLNLLRVFAAIWSHKHLGEAAQALHVTPSAVSHALRRLREQLGDPLFLREGRRLRPTPRAEQLGPAVRAHLGELAALLAPLQRFDPAATQRRFVLGLREALEPLVLPELFARLQRHAPGLQLASVRLDRARTEIELREGRLDLVIDVARPPAPGIGSAALLQEALCVTMRAGHPLRDGMRVEDYLRMPHVLVSGRPSGPGIEDSALATLGLGARHTVLRCQNYYAASLHVAQSDALLTLPTRLARAIGRPLGNLLRSLPFAAPPMGLALHWHAERADAGIDWLRAQTLAAAGG